MLTANKAANGVKEITLANTNYQVKFTTGVLRALCDKYNAGIVDWRET